MPLATIETLQQVKNKYKQRLLAYPNVTAVAVGPKTKNGKTDGTLAVKVYVRRKVPLSELAENERIPEQLDGLPTDVEALSTMRAR